MKKIIILCFSLLFPLVSHGLMLREAGEMDLGITGGYGFPQLGFWNSRGSGSHMNQFSKEYSFGLSFNTFFLDDLSLLTEVLYTFNRIGLERSDSQRYIWEDHFVDVDIMAQKYWFEFFYLAGGLYFRLPFYGGSTNAPGYTGRTATTIGALLEVGVDMKFFDHFALKIALRSHLPFMSYLSLSKNQYTLWTFPINLMFSLEWVI